MRYVTLLAALLSATSAYAQPDLAAVDKALKELTAAVEQLRKPASQTVYVPAGGNLQAALDAATPGSTIELAQGQTYAGNYVFRNRPGPVTLRTFGMSDLVLPPTVRITRAETRLAKLTCQDCYLPILRADPGTRGVQVIAVQLLGYTPAPGRQGPLVPDRDMVQLGIALDGVAWYTRPEQIVSDVTFDRVQWTAGPAGGHKAGLLDGRNIAVINSDCRGFWELARDSQCFSFSQGPGPVRLENNYLEAASENVIFGGNDPVMSGAITRGVVVRGNHFSKPDAWRPRGRYQVKNLFELKNAIDVLVEQNLFEHNWTDAQAGSAILFTVRNQDGQCAWCEVSDVLFRWNVVRDVEGFAVALLGRDYTHPSATSKRIVITQNLFLAVGNGVSVQGPIEDVTITHNTMLGIGGPLVPGRDRGRFLALDGLPATRLVVRDNVAQGGDYGITGSNVAPGMTALVAFAPGFSVTHNVIEGTSVRRVVYPPGNYLLLPGTLSATGTFPPVAGIVSSDGLPLGVDVAELRKRVTW